jgi:hypothetical protein
MTYRHTLLTIEVAVCDEDNQSNADRLCGRMLVAALQPHSARQQ